MTHSASTATLEDHAARAHDAGPALTIVTGPPAAKRSLDDPWLATIASMHHVGLARLFYAGAAKRAIDIVVASVALVVLSPLFLAIAVAIKWKSPGSVFFVHERCGRDGRPFPCYKFRTMVPNAHLILEQDERFRNEYQQSWKLVRDPRVTAVGSFLRKTSLDELPQLWNVLLGHMSLVGPRPVPHREMYANYGQHADIVTKVRPGMTGLWQVSGRSNLAYEERVKLDVNYVRRLTFVFDMLIILRTIPALLGSKDAF